MKIVRAVYIIAGSFFLALGFAGAFLPILPTTPFLLLTAYCYARGSQRFYNWFASTKIYKNHLESFVRNRSMTLKTKLSILFTASFMLLFPLFILKSLWAKAFILFLMAFKYFYFFTQIKTIKESDIYD